MSFPAALGSNSHECQRQSAPIHESCLFSLRSTSCVTSEIPKQASNETNVELPRVVGTRLVVGRGTKRIFWFLKGLGWVVWG